MSLEISRNTLDNTSHAIVSGTYFDGADAYPIIAQAPGYVPSPWGSDESAHERLVLNSQAYANMIAGRVIANDNREIKDVSIPLAGNWLPALDIAPQNWVQLNVQADDTKREVSLEGYYHLRTITSEINVTKGTSLVDVVLEPEAFGPDGVPGPYPDDWPWPRFPLPDFPEFPPWSFPRWETLMVRNCFGMPPAWNEKTPYYQRTVINDPSSILPALSGSETTNLLYETDVHEMPEMVTDGICIYFHQIDYSYAEGWDYSNRIWRHDIATGLVDYLELPNDTMSAGTLTCIDIGIVAAIIWDDDYSYETARLFRLDFNTGVVEQVYSYYNQDIADSDVLFCATMQSTVNVYTVFETTINDINYDSSYTLFHKYNWTTGESVVTEVWNVSNMCAPGDIYHLLLLTAPVIIGDEIYAFYSAIYNDLPLDGTLRCWAVYYNYITNEHGFSSYMAQDITKQEPYMIKAAPYEDLNRIYFQTYERYSDWYLCYIDTLTKEIVVGESINGYHSALICNKNKCCMILWDTPQDAYARVIDPYTKEERNLGLKDWGDDSLWNIRTRLAWCVDDIDDTIYTYLGGYIISNQIEGALVNEASVPHDESLAYWIWIMGRTFVIVQRYGGQYYKAWVVHYPGSVIIEEV